ncbi:MAG: Pyrimidine reductase riboflavin biosynthesis-like protein [Acidimicrobiales bacterium]|nr:Pyrimidine reductase riboflavin biosynthesis-like protein [Acidimicrobiales bacterium]
MQQLFPESAEVEPAQVYAGAPRPAWPDRPWVMVNMIASVDGATARDGVSGGLGSPADKVVFSAIRAVADVILAGAGTVRAEGYGPPRPPAERQAERTARGQAAVPRIAVVSRSLDLDLGGRLFTESVERPLVITTTDAAPARLAACRRVADVITAGTGAVDLQDALGQLRATGVGIVVAEGGPGINGQLVAAGIVDEMCLSLAPLLVGGGSARVAHGMPAAALGLRLAHVLHDEADDLLFLRYRRA